MPHETGLPLAELVWPEERYARSTNIEWSKRAHEDVPDYKFTPKALRLLEEVLASSQEKSHERAWSVIGAYGAGKSTFALFLLQLFTDASSVWFRQCLTHLEHMSPAIAQRLHTEILIPEGQYVPVVVQGARMAPDLAFCQALAKAATLPSTNTSWASQDFLARLQGALQDFATGVIDSPRLMTLYEEASHLAQCRGYRGLLVIVDEFGKFLEQAAWQGALPDLVVVQYLAELATSLQTPQILFFVLLHQGFQHYASSLSQPQWLEWAKIQGRFRQIDFNEDPENLYEVIATSLHRKDASGAVRTAVAGWVGHVWSQVQHFPAFTGTAHTNFWPTLLERAYPLHPLVLYALPRLSARLGQHERTLFAFLASDDPLGLKAFLRRTLQSTATLPSLTLDYLFDYFVSGVRFTLLPADVRKQVSQIEAARDRLGDRPALEDRLLKVLGVLGILKVGPLLPASVEVLAAALDAGGEAAQTAIREALDSLLARKIIVFRRFSGEYKVWEGSDFDFEGALAQAQEDIRTNFRLSERLEDELRPRPLLARRHTFETGTTRLFATKFLAAAEALPLHHEDLIRIVEESHTDGMVCYLLPANMKELQDSEHWVQTLAESQLVVAVPKTPLGISALLLDLAALRKIPAAWPELRDDPVAMKELAARIDVVEERLRESLDTVMEPAVQGAQWYWQGQGRSVSDRRQLHQLLSEVCDTVYPLAPRIRNELVNRQSLSTAVIVAVKKIIQALLTAQGVASLGFTGNGPEVSIFRAVLEAQGLYQPDHNGVWHVCRPSETSGSSLRAVWLAIERFLQSAEARSGSFSDLYDLLTKPPYGLRKGLVPLLVWIVLIAHRHAVCLYEHGTYIREWTPEVFDLFVKAPAAFTVRWLIVEPQIGLLVQELNTCLPHAVSLAEAAEEVSLTGFLHNLYRWYHALPNYAKHTQRVSDRAREFRHVLTTVVDPVDLILRRFPEALGIEELASLEDGGNKAAGQTFARYIHGFATVVTEIDAVYTTLLHALRSDLATRFGCQHMVAALRQTFQGLEPEVLKHLTDTTARAFLLRACDENAPDGPWLESLGAVLTSQGPKFWMDHHYEEFRDRLALVAFALSDAHKRYYALTAFDEAQQWPMKRIVIEEQGKTVFETFVSPRELDATYEEAAQTLLSFLEHRYPHMAQRPKQIALAKALELLSVAERDA